MRAVWLEPDQDYLDQRHRWGLDRGDEVWDGVLHMAPFPVFEHELVASTLLVALTPLAKRCGLVAVAAALLEHEKNYRKPDLTLGRADQISERGFEGAELVIEVLSPNDESRLKFSFFAKLGVREVWLIEPKTRELELYELRDGRYVRQLPPLVSSVLGVPIEQREGQLIVGDAVI